MFIRNSIVPRMKHVHQKSSAATTSLALRLRHRLRLNGNVYANAAAHSSKGIQQNFSSSASAPAASSWRRQGRGRSGWSSESQAVRTATLMSLAPALLVSRYTMDSTPASTESSTDAPGGVEPGTDADPYENLPEKDEPTHCSICKTYRQGPCRPFWRKVEACTKDHAPEEDEKPSSSSSSSSSKTAADSDAKGDKNNTNADDDDGPIKEPSCMKYMMPFVECATEFRNLYNLIEMDTNYTLGIQDLEKEAAKSLCWTKTNGPVVDWTAWEEYVAENPDWKPSQTTTESKSDAVSAGMPLWRQLKQDEEPNVISIEVHVAQIEPDEVGQLECAYALDQDGHVIGFAYGNSPPAASKSQDGTAPQEPFVTMKVRIIVERAKHFTIGASYLRETEPVANDDAKDGKDAQKNEKTQKKKTAKPVISHMYKSHVYNVPVAAKK